MADTASRSGVAKNMGFKLSNHTQSVIDEKTADDCLQIIGAGLPRCGTSSLKRALEILGFNPCHHMVDCIDYPVRSVTFTSLLNSQNANDPSTLSDPARLATLKKAMRGYKATVDSPVCDLYRELTQIYPDAKCILSVRDSPDVWWTSFTTTIAGSLTPTYRILTLPIPFLRKQRTLLDAIVHKWATEGGGYGPEKYVQHGKEVREWVPKEKLLEFNVKQGWEPLCKFLGVAVPDEPFPHLNDANDIKTAFFAAKMMGLLAWVAGIGVVAGATWLAMAPPDFVKNLLTSS